MAKTDKQLSKRVLVLVKRDVFDQTPTVVWEHELPIIEAVYGEGKFEVMDSGKLDEGYKAKPTTEMLVFNKTQETPQRPSEASGIGFVFIGDPRAEYDRLVAKYGRNADNEKITNVEFVYGRFQDRRFAPLLGEPTLEDLPEAQLRYLIREAGVFQPMRYEATKDEKDAASKSVAAFLKATRVELLKLAAEAGVEVAR